MGKWKVTMVTFSFATELQNDKKKKIFHFRKNLHQKTLSLFSQTV